MKKIPFLVGLGIVAVLALVALGVLLWPLAVKQVQAAGSQSLALQQPHTDCPRHGGRMMFAPPSEGAVDDCPMHTGEADTDCPMQGEDCTGDCSLHTDGSDCPMQGGVDNCPLQGSMGVEGCPMEDGTVK